MTFQELRFEGATTLLAKLIKCITGSDNRVIVATGVAGTLTALNSQVGTRVTIFNATGVTLHVSYATGDYLTVPNGGAVTLPVTANASELKVATEDASSQTIRALVENL